jgi:hypothetical protein
VTAAGVLAQNDGEVTRAYYAELTACGIEGEIAVALFRAQKRSSRAKEYRRGKWRRAAYDVKSWSMSELCRLLIAHGAAFEIKFGWKRDPKVQLGYDPSWVLYVDLPEGQVSFHFSDKDARPGLFR